jgi:HlyD family secretion protein
VAPSPLGHAVLYCVVALAAATFAWAALARLDIVAVAEGKLVPAGYLKIVQPAESGIVEEILVREGEAVRAGQVLARMDAALAEADARALASDYHARRLALRRIDAQLAARALARQSDDPPEAFAHADAQHAANVRAYESALAQERSVRERAYHDLAAAEATRAKAPAGAAALSRAGAGICEVSGRRLCGKAPSFR